MNCQLWTTASISNRYKSIFGAEVLFTEYKKDLYRSYRKQLAKRLVKQILLVKNKQIALYTLRQLFNKGD